MSRRRGITVRVDFDTDGGVSPNAYMPVVTAEVRVFWPPRATEAEIMNAIHEGADAAVAAVLANGDFISTIPAAPAIGVVDSSAPVVQAGDQIV